MVAGPPRWNTALAYAITGQRWADLPESGGPDLDHLATEIGRRYPGSIDALRNAVDARRRSGEPWPHPLPADLAEGIGAAQWLAAVAGMRERLQLEPQPQRPVLSDRGPDADELRLLHDVPPHHGH